MPPRAAPMITTELILVSDEALIRDIGEPVGAIVGAVVGEKLVIVGTLATTPGTPLRARDSVRV